MWCEKSFLDNAQDTIKKEAWTLEWIDVNELFSKWWSDLIWSNDDLGLWDCAFEAFEMTWEELFLWKKLDVIVDVLKKVPVLKKYIKDNLTEEWLKELFWLLNEKIEDGSISVEHLKNLIVQNTRIWLNKIKEELT